MSSRESLEAAQHGWEQAVGVQLRRAEVAEAEARALKENQLRLAAAYHELDARCDRYKAVKDAAAAWLQHQDADPGMNDIGNWQRRCGELVHALARTVREAGHE